MNELKISGIHPDKLDEVWPVLTPFLLKALKHADGKYALEDIKDAIREAMMQLSIIIDHEHNIHAVIVTQFVEYPRKKIMLFVLVSGIKFSEWQHTLDDFIKAAKKFGADSVEAYGREGWGEKLKPLGFKRIYSYYTLAI